MREVGGSMPSNSILWHYVEMVSCMVWDYAFQVRFLVEPFYIFRLYYRKVIILSFCKKKIDFI